MVMSGIGCYHLLIILPRAFWFCREPFDFAVSLWFYRELFGFDVPFGFVVSLLVSSCAVWFYRGLFGFDVPFGFVVSLLVFLGAFWFCRVPMFARYLNKDVNKMS